MSGLEDREAAAGAVAKAPRVTLDQIKTLISSERYFLDDTLTICVLTLTNGYKVTGESAAADPANFNPELGRKIAKDKATAEIWPLAGFLLRDKLYRDDHPAVMRCKLTLGSRQPMIMPAMDDEYRPLGRYTEQEWSYGEGPCRRTGVSFVPDESDPANKSFDGEMLSFHGVCPPTCGGDAPENLIFGEASPFVKFEAHIRNRQVLEQLRAGAAYYVDFIPAE